MKSAVGLVISVVLTVMDIARLMMVAAVMVMVGYSVVIDDEEVILVSSSEVVVLVKPSVFMTRPEHVSLDSVSL